MFGGVAIRQWLVNAPTLWYYTFVVGVIVTCVSARLLPQPASLPSLATAETTSDRTTLFVCRSCTAGASFPASSYPSLTSFFDPVSFPLSFVPFYLAASVVSKRFHPLPDLFQLVAALLFSISLLDRNALIFISWFIDVTSAVPRCSSRLSARSASCVYPTPSSSCRRLSLLLVLLFLFSVWLLADIIKAVVTKRIAEELTIPEAFSFPTSFGSTVPRHPPSGGRSRRQVNIGSKNE